MNSSEDRVVRFVEALRDDPRVVGVARFTYGPPDVAYVLVVTTWDGLEPLARELPRQGTHFLGDGPRIEEVKDGKWTGVAVDGTRAEIALRRVGDLVPDFEGAKAEPLHDPRGLIEQWVRYSRARPEARAAEEHVALPPHVLLAVDATLRERAPGGIGGGPREANPLLRMLRKELRDELPAEAALARRIDHVLAAQPLDGAGLRGPAGEDPAASFERFLAVADAEGFKGDRVLFGEAVKRLRDLSKREPVFEQGFVVPTFDAVEAGFALGEAVGGCKPPLVPGVYVGVGVTPTDALEFWAAPFVRDPTCSVACVDDTGERDVVLRAAGREPMISALTSSIDAAFERLPALIDAARAAAKESVDPAAVFAPLHLPKTFIERAKRRGADALMCSRLTVALSLARAGNDAAPLVARKLGLAAGRALAKR